LRQSFLLAHIPAQAVAELLTEGWRSLPFSKGEIIFGRGKNQDALGLIVRGRASAKSGNAVILRGFAKGDLFGAAALFAATGEPFNEIVAESAGEALLLPREAVSRLLASQPRAAENYIRFLAQRIAFLNRKISSLSSGETIKRLAAHISAACQPDPVGRPVFKGNISRLAQSLGISRASLYRGLEQLQEDGCLHREGKTVVIDSLERLSEYK
jgi:CRP-like cAMP-binding protein